MQVLRTLSIIFLLLSTFSYSQSEKEDYSSCEGVLNIFKTQSFDLQFLGKKEKTTVFAEYPALSSITSANQIWFSFIAPYDGVISLDIESNEANLSLVVFDTLFNEFICNEIKQGNAEIRRLVLPPASNKIGLNKNVNPSFLYPIDIHKGKILYFVVIADNDKKAAAHLDFKFESTDPSVVLAETKTMNLKKERNTPTFKVVIVDKENGAPLISSLIIKGAKRYEGFYRVSELVFDGYRTPKMEYSCEHDGYFQNDSIGIFIKGDEDYTLTIEMDPIRSGKSVQIEELEFVPGTSQIAESSIPKLKRLRDFLALNSKLHFEIQGHVYEPGEDNSFSGQKMSEARAKRVMKYLSDNGIDKNRMTAIGYGNTRPAYIFPKTASEEQANRRVEILIK